MGAVRPARARRREAVGLRYRWRWNPRLHSRWHRGSSRNYQGSDRSRRLISRRVYRGAQRMLTFLVMTGEDEQPDGKLRARENVIHEAGLFQGKLGFERAIVLLEDECEEFSNIHGLNQI